jgi:hypothetical protein
MDKKIPDWNPSFKSLVRTHYKGGYKLEVFKGLIGVLHWRLTKKEGQTEILIDSDAVLTDFDTPIGEAIRKDDIEELHNLVRESK